MADLLPVAALTGPRDLFRCDPFHASITVATCHQRRGATYGGGRMRGHTPAKHAAFPECARCALGAAVHAQVPPAPVADVTCSASGCGAVVTGAGQRKPLCPQHRRAMRVVGVGAMVRERISGMGAGR